MKLTNKNLQEDKIEELVISLGDFILSTQAPDGSIPSKEDGTHDPWDHLEAVMGLIIQKNTKELSWESTGCLQIKTATAVGITPTNIQIQFIKTNKAIIQLILLQQLIIIF